MASQSSFESSASTPVDNPSIPQPFGTELRAKSEVHMATSPTTSMLVSGVSANHSSSFTPPPSSQMPSTRNFNAHSITPEPCFLSSPPPTALGSKKRLSSANDLLIAPTAEQMAKLAPSEVKELLERVLTQNTRLEAMVAEARTSAAHHKMQYNLLAFEKGEEQKRMEVEHDLTRKEVQVLQGTGREPVMAQFTRYIDKLKTHCENIQIDNSDLIRRLHRAKKLIEKKDYELSEEKDRNSRLMERIRQNHHLRSPGGPLHPSTPRTGPATPRYRGTPNFTPTTNRCDRFGREQANQGKFDALLLAGSILNQENNSAPSTPVVARRGDPRTPNRHNRGVQSLSSFSTTPGSARLTSAKSTLLPSAISPYSEARINISQPHTQERRRKSRDSTISVSDHEEISRATNSYREESPEIQESRASQSATDMLRADPRESFEVVASRTTTPLPEKSKPMQSKIYLPITKTPIDKRKRDDEELGGGPMKKLRPEGGGIGLGIGFATN